MKTIKAICTIILILSTTLGTACVMPSAATPTATATDTPIPPTPTEAFTATKTPIPTIKLIPTATYNATSTAQYNQMFDVVSSLYDDGWISSQEGSYRHLQDFSTQWAQLSWYQRWPTGVNAGDFVYKAHLSWTNDSETPNPSGCGITFRNQENSHHYVVFVLTSGYINMNIATDKSRSQGTQGYGAPHFEGEADLVLAAIGNKIDVFIDGEHMKTFTGFEGKMLDGELMYTVLSGTNKGFGTQCDITESDLWLVR